MSSLRGYVTATYSEIVEVFGEPTFADTSFDDKVNTEWEIYDEDAGKIRIYDWKDYDGGKLSRSDVPYIWHIGGDTDWSRDFIGDRLGKTTTSHRSRGYFS